VAEVIEKVFRRRMASYHSSRKFFCNDCRSFLHLGEGHPLPSTKPKTPKASKIYLMQCPQCDTALRLEVKTDSELPLVNPAVRWGFRIIDLFAATALIAVHFAAFPVLASSSGSEWPLLLYFSPTAITCLLHLRLRLGTSTAMVVHYAVLLAWFYLYSLGQYAAINAHNPMQRSGGSVQIDVYATAWDDMIGLVDFGFAWAGAYGLICYTALNASRPVPTARPHLSTTEIGTGQRERNSIGL
jgi:hypothetical protein